MAGKHPVDRMAEIRDQLAELEREYAELRGRLVAGEIEPEGDEWLATVTHRTQRRITVKDAERALPAATVAGLVRSMTQIVVVLNRKHTNRPRADR
jgi:hypothetical protein